MLFVKIANTRPVANYLSKLIKDKLDGGQKVLWFISGGSAIKIAAETAQALKSNPNIGRLSVTLIDERFGLPGHADSNWQQLKEGGFSLPGAHLLPVLEGKNIAQTAEDFEKTVAEQLNKNDFKVALLGIGADGHTSGILPGSPAVSAKSLVIAFNAADYSRITTTPAALLKIDEAVVYASGEAKWPQLDRLGQNLALNDQPAQIFKKIKEVTIYNDYKGAIA